MVIDNLHVMRAVRFPAKADPPLVVDPDAVLSLAPALQRLKAVAGRHPQLFQFHRRIQHFQFPLHDRQQVAGETPGPDTLKNFPRLVTPKTLDHGK